MSRFIFSFINIQLFKYHLLKGRPPPIMLESMSKINWPYTAVSFYSYFWLFFPFWLSLKCVMHTLLWLLYLCVWLENGQRELSDSILLLQSCLDYPESFIFPWTFKNQLLAAQGVELLPTICKTLSSNPSTEKQTANTTTTKRQLVKCRRSAEVLTGIALNLKILLKRPNFWPLTSNPSSLSY